MTDARQKLSPAQYGCLLLAEGTGRRGYSATAAHPSFNALLRRGLVTAQHCCSSFDNRRWVATYAGRAWLAVGRARMMAS